MTVAIPLPDPVSKAAEELASRLGISLSQLCTAAVESFVDSHSFEALNEKRGHLLDRKYRGGGLTESDDRLLDDLQDEIESLLPNVEVSELEKRRDLD